MSLIDKLRDMQAESPDRDLLEYFGIEPGAPFAVTKDGLTVGDETISLADARLALTGGPIPQSPAPRRTVAIGDL
jgi:hypothetical protein